MLITCGGDATPDAAAPLLTIDKINTIDVINGKMRTIVLFPLFIIKIFLFFSYFTKITSKIINKTIK